MVQSGGIWRAYPRILPRRPKLLTTAVVVNSVTPSEFDFDNASIAISGFGFIATRGTGTVFISDGVYSVDVGTAVASWNNTAISLNLTLLSAPIKADLADNLGPGTRYIIVRNSQGQRGQREVLAHRIKAFNLSASSWITASGENTLARLRPPAGKTDTSFGGGRIQDDENPGDTVDLATNQYREEEFSVIVTDGAVDYADYEFRLYMPGDPAVTHVHPYVSVVPFVADPTPPASTGPTYPLIQLLKDDDPYVVTGGAAWGSTFLYPVPQIPSALSAVGKDVAFVWDDRTSLFDINALLWDIKVPVFDTTTYLWDIRAALGDPVALRWDILFALGDPITYRWDIRTAIADTITYRWDIFTPLGDPIVFRWDQFTKTFDTTGLLWDIRAALGDPIAFRWDQFITGGDQVVLRWDLRFALGDPLDLLWDLRFALADPLDVRWDVIGPVPKILSLLWDDRAFVFDSIVLRWDQFVTGGDQASFLWDLRFALGDTNTLRWDLRFGLGDTATLRWDIRAVISDQAALLWDIKVPVFDTTTFRWDILTRLGDPADFRWDIFTKLGDQADFRWDVRFALGDPIALLWDLFAAAVATQRGYRFRNDDGSETTATWITSQNLNITIGKETRFRLRMLTDFLNDPDPAALTLQYKLVGEPDTEWQTVEPV